MMQPQAKVLTCKKHNIELLFYCETCEELVCRCCTMKDHDHDGHEYDTVKLIASKYRNTFEKLTTDLAHTHGNIINMIKAIKQKGKEEINQLHDVLFLKLKEQKDQTTQQACDAVIQKKEALKEQLKQLEHAKTDLEQIKCSTEESSDQEVLSAMWQVIDHIKELSVKYKELSTEPVHSATMEFVPTKQTFPQFIQMLTSIDPAVCENPNCPIPVGEKVETATTAKHHSGHYCSKGGSQVSLQLESIMREVTAVQVRDIDGSSYAVSYTGHKIGNLMCKEHIRKLSLYCKVCEELVCMYCTVEDHAGHEHDTVEVMARKCRNKMEVLTASAEEMLTGLRQAHENIDKVIKKVTKRGEEVDKEIVHYYSKLFQNLEEEKDRTKVLALDAVMQNSNALEQLEKQLKQIKRAQETLLIKELKDFIEKNSDGEFLAESQHLKQLIVKYTKLNMEVTMELKQPFPLFGQLFTNIDPVACEVVNFPNSIPVGEKVEFTVITKYHNGLCCSKGGSQVSVQLQSNCGEVTAAQVMDNDNGRYVASFTSRYIGKVKILVSINGEQIKGSPYTVNM